MRFFQLLFRYTLNNVVFGIALMVAIGLYIAIGSGVVSVREHFELSDLEFFNAWPLKLLMLLLCLSLATVTWNRIPLTPPRYGVWCIHSGIVTLIIGTSLYYHFKVEGRTLIPVNQTAVYFYDTSRRAIYARVPDRAVFGVHALPSLPRFGDYPPEDLSPRFSKPDLQDIQRLDSIGPQTPSTGSLADWLGLAQPVRLDIIGYYAYADVAQDVIEDPSSSDSGVELKVDSPHGDSGSLILTTADPAAARQIFGITELEQRDVSQASLQMIRDAAQNMFRLTVARPNQSPKSFQAQLGQTYDLGHDCTATLDSFNPAFPLFGTHEPVQALTLHLVSKSPPREFWRMILAGRTLQTDFKMDPATTPPFVKGNRQKEPLDKDLVLGFSFLDAADLLPSQGGEEKHTLLTSGKTTLLDIHTSFTQPAQIADFSAGGQIPLNIEDENVIADVRRLEHVKVLSHVVPTPTARREKDLGESGVKQVVVVRVSCGDWSQDVSVPCDLYAAPDPIMQEPFDPWNLGTVRIPGAKSPLQLQLGFVPLPLPALLTLRKFELVRYPGAENDSGPFRDFRSTLEVQDATGDKTVAVASGNNPIYFDGGRYIFFQAGYDPDAKFSILGIGNRPGVGIMIAGCVMIVAGLLYAFYVKPLIIRKMKAAALARAARQTPVTIP
ncbi:MAG: hypothetical protein ABSF29_07410 [Tepidisphaeraceae bacterium]